MSDDCRLRGKRKKDYLKGEEDKRKNGKRKSDRERYGVTDVNILNKSTRWRPLRPFTDFLMFH